LSIDEQDIFEAEYTEYEGAPYIRVRFKGMIYVHVYYISINTGLLDYASKYDGEALVYAMSVINN